MGSWGRVPRYDRIRSRHIEWSTHRGAKGLVRVNGMCNFARDVPAGVHVHDYRRTGERE